MLEEDKLTTTEQQALDIAENPAHITPEQLDALLSDDAMLEQLNEVEGLRQAVRQACRPNDVEEHLAAWHRSHADAHAATHDSKTDSGTDTETHRLPMVARLLRIAAVFAGVVVMAAAYWHFSRTTDNADNIAMQEKGQKTVFTADKDEKDITIAADGKDITLKNNGKSHSATITKADLEALLSDASNTEQLTLSVPHGKTADLTLPDGTAVYMHPGSRIVFPNRFAGSHRIVKFEGEAYFCVAHDAAHPFVVKSGTMETTVLGTEFNISTPRHEVCLVKGKVRLNAVMEDKAEEARGVTLAPHHCATLNGTEFSVTKADVTPYEFWRDGYLYFENNTLQDIMEKIGQTFNMTVIFRNTELMKCRMRFIAPRTEGAAAAVDAINSMKKAVVMIKGNTLFVD